MSEDSASGVKSTSKDSLQQLTQISTKDIPEVRTRLLKKQKGRCPICEREIKDPVLDHDHATGAVRSTLCRNCNRFEGKVLQWVKTVPLDNIQLLKNLAKYWKRHSYNLHGLVHPGKTTKRKRRKKNASIRSKRSSGSDRATGG